MQKALDCMNECLEVFICLLSLTSKRRMRLDTNNSKIFYSVKLTVVCSVCAIMDKITWKKISCYFIRDDKRFLEFSSSNGFLAIFILPILIQIIIFFNI